ncbi:hypothetical protein D2T29_12730 [Sinirhodobacter populi]|uniref:Uncharacterized protein n=1 Tax=Paenirhodobacter populi TaxID=2306993 RepID=A0A443KCP0_9RHOB|nr:hypothetical protein [Sinirhodobacter populi]RWR30530.1 hypothetical protein D2T29_12730 [Sinirhodobacter populi]
MKKFNMQTLNIESEGLGRDFIFCVSAISAATAVAAACIAIDRYLGQLALTRGATFIMLMLIIPLGIGIPPRVSMVPRIFVGLFLVATAFVLVLVHNEIMREIVVAHGWTSEGCAQRGGEMSVIGSTFGINTVCLLPNGSTFVVYQLPPVSQVTIILGTWL